MSIRNTENHPAHEKHSPKMYIIGYIASLVLTAISYLLALTHPANAGQVIVIMTILGGFQIIVQLFFFMHITEGEGPPFHSALLILGLIFTFAIALMSVWIMAFGTNLTY